jgi:hypothetical protein
MVDQKPKDDPGKEIPSPADDDSLSDENSESSGDQVYRCWQAPDRDSLADAVDLDFKLEISDNSNKTLHALLQLDGINAYDEEEVFRKTGQKIERPRRWGKLFERMGLMYREGQLTRLTDLGRKLAETPATEKREFRRKIAREALKVLSLYQLRNPADDPQGRYPEDCDVFPYWCIWKAADALGGRLHWDELNRELMRVLKMADLDARIERIVVARKDADYDAVKGGSKAHPLENRCYEELDPPGKKTADGQVRDHYMTPWLKRAGFGGLLLESPGIGGDGYWTIPDDLSSEIKDILRQPPKYHDFESKAEWFEHYGRINSASEGTTDDDAGEFREKENDKLPDDDPVWQQVNALLASGSLTIILSGPPGTSKTWYAWRLASKIADYKRNNVKRIQFHPSYSYDDFIEGYIPVPPKAGEVSGPLFQVVPKLFLNLCSDARKRPDEKFVLVIDEMTRGDIGRIFGELLTYLEPDYRNKRFFLAYSGRPASIPSNVIILGTMNPFDRSITELDDALERRFDRVAVVPDVRILRLLLTNAGAQGELLGKVIRFFNEANGLVAHGFGQTYFLGVDSEAALVRVWNHKLKFVFEKIFRFDNDKYQQIRDHYAAQLADATQLL